MAEPTPASPRDLPSRVGRYEVLRELGRGGMGVVLAAHDPVMQREVAIKLVHPEQALAPEGFERFRREALALARLAHPGIVNVFDVGRDGPRPFLVMELVPGESLQRRIEREGPLPPGEVVRLGIALAQALGHAHSQGVLHRDVKPHNVLLDLEGKPRLTDLGLARLRGGPGGKTLTLDGQVLGTPAYMPPEQADAARDLDATADVYSLGATLYAALVGRPPFEGPTALNVLHAVLTRPVVPPRELRPDVPPALEGALLRCLDKEPAVRFASAEALAAALEQARLRPDWAGPRASAGEGDDGPRVQRARPRAPSSATTLAPVVVGALALVVVALVAIASRRAPSAAPPGAPSGPAAPAPVPSAAAVAPSPTTLELDLADGALLDAPEVTLEGRVVTGRAESVRVGARRAAVADDGRFRVGPCPLDEGPNAVRVEALDEAGAVVTSASVTVVLDATPPTLEVAEPAEGAAAVGSDVAVVGRVRDVTRTRLWIDGVEVPLVDGAFAQRVPLGAPGPRPIALRARDAAGHEVTRTLTVSVPAPPATEPAPPASEPAPVATPVVPAPVADPGPALPAVRITAPRDGQTTSEESVRLRVSVAGGVDVALRATVDGLPVPIAGGEGVVWLEPGPNVVEVAAVAGERRGPPTTLTVTRRLPASRKAPEPLPPGLVPGSRPGEYVNEVDGSVLVWVAGGTFPMGRDDGDDDERPVHEVTLSGFFLGKTEVTWRQWRRMFQARGGRPPAPTADGAPVGEDHPVGSVTWGQARAYCEWAGLRLPTEAEWEYAARGPTGRRWPWGDAPPDSTRLNSAGEQDGFTATSPVGWFRAGASPFGALDMAGNVSEWVHDWSGPYPSGRQIDPQGPAGPPKVRVVRGWSWASPASATTFRAADRSCTGPERVYEQLGFRVARSSRR